MEKKIIKNLDHIKNVMI